MLDKIIEDLKTALSKIWDAQSREYMLTLLDFASLGDTLSSSDAEHIQYLAGSFLGEPLAQAARRPIIQSTTDAYLHGKKLLSADFALTAKDLNALQILQQYSFHVVGSAYDRFVAGNVKDIVQEYFDRGHTRAQLAEGMSVLMGNRAVPKIQDYFGIMADHLTSKISEMGHVSGYEEAGIEQVEVVAILDDRTTPICRQMHGRIIPVSALSDQRDRILSAAQSGDLGAIKAAQPQVSGKRETEICMMGKTSDIIKSGMGLPPYHFRCRTTTVAYFAPSEFHEKAKQWAIDGEIPFEEQKNLISYAKNSHWGTHSVTWPKSYGGDGEKHPTAFVHYKKHASQVGANSMDEYNIAAMNLVRGGSRDVYLAIEDKMHPHPVLFFHNPKTQELAIIHIKGQNIATYHVTNAKQWERKLKKQQVCLKLKGGVMKWIKSMLS